MIHAVNVTTFPLGSKTKRAGYSAFLENPDSSQVQSLFSFPNIANNGTALNLYRASGSTLYYSEQGTGSWTVPANGTIASNSHVGHAILSNTMIIGDGVGSTRHSVSGSTFIDTSLAPVSPDFMEYHRRVYALGTSQTEFYSTSNDATNWNTSGTSDSNSFEVPGAGKLLTHFKSEDKLIIPKSQGQIFRWDDFSLVDTATSYGPSSPYSVDEVEGYYFFANQLGIYGYSGGKPQLISNAIQRQFYNDEGTGIAGLSVGDFTDDFTSRTITNGVIKYDYQKNDFLNWSLAHKPTAFHSYKDVTGSQQLIFGDATGQVYKTDSTFTDNGSPIVSEMVYIYNYKQPAEEKKWNRLILSFNPGCEAQVQIACSNTYTYEHLNWVEIGDVSDGVVDYKLPEGSRSRYLFLRIYDSSITSRFTYYGCSISAEIMKNE